MTSEQQNFLNCFTPGPPVCGDNFFGRTVLMDLLKRSLQSGMSVLLIGERRIGKTSILRQINFLVSEEGWGISTTSTKLILTYMPWATFSLAKDASHLIIRKIARGLLWSEGLPSNVTSALCDLDSEDADLITLLKCLRGIREEGYQLVILFDELDAVILDGPPKLAGVLREIITQGHIVTIATSFRDPTEVHSKTHFGSPWFNLFHIEFIGLFTDEEAIELLTVLSHRSGRQFTEAECLFLMNVFGNFPYYLQMAGSQIFSGLHQFVSCSSRHRTRLIMEALIDVTRQLPWHFQYTINHLNAEEVELLLDIARNKPVRHSRKLERLQARGMVTEREEGRYQIFARFFEEFLKELPEPSIAEKAGESKTWETISSIAGDVLETALTKAIEIAAQRYF